MIAYCEAKKIPVQASAKKPYSMDRNLLHISFESGMLEDPWFDASAPEHKDMYKLSVSPEDAPDRARLFGVAIRKGKLRRSRPSGTLGDSERYSAMTGTATTGLALFGSCAF